MGFPNLNRWNYTESTPVNYIDPSGYWCVAGFSFGPGRDCSEEEMLRWSDFYQNQTMLYSRLMSSQDDRSDFVAGFGFEYLDTITVLPIMTITFSAVDSLTGCGWNTSRYTQGRIYTVMMQTNQMFTAGRYAARAFLIAQSLTQIGVGITGVSGGIGVSAITGGVASIIGLPVSTASALLAGHGALVLATVGARSAIDPLRPLNFSASARGGGNHWRPLKKSDLPDSYKPPRGGPRKVKVQHGPYRGRTGWLDKDGNIWVPSKPAESHGGPHWDVQINGGKNGHRNVFP